VGNTYVPVGGQCAGESPGKKNPWNALFGSIVYPAGEGIYTVHERKRHEEARTRLKILTEWKPDVFRFVVMDNASAHTTPKPDIFREQNRDCMEQVFLPAYSPNLNLIERVWRFMRGQVSKKQFYPTLKELCEAAVEWLNRLPFSRFCSVTGIDEADLQFIKRPF